MDSAGLDAGSFAYLTHCVEFAAAEPREWEPEPAPPQTQTHTASSRCLHAQITASSSPSPLASEPIISLPIGSSCCHSGRAPPPGTQLSKSHTAAAALGKVPVGRNVEAVAHACSPEARCRKESNFEDRGGLLRTRVRETQEVKVSHFPFTITFLKRFLIFRAGGTLEHRH